MIELGIDLGGDAKYLAPLYNMPPAYTSDELFAKIKYWFTQTLVRDGFISGPDDPSIAISVSAGSSDIWITLDAASGTELPPGVDGYPDAMYSFLEIGASAWNDVVPQLKANGQWDPHPDPDPAKRAPWEFFLPHGLPMLNFRTIQFFHYPPYRLYDQGDYLKDPVPDRWNQLLETAGADPTKTDLYQRYLDAVPIAANDDQGAYMPVAAFAEYQRDMLNLFLKLGKTPNPAYSVPVLVFGIPAMAQFEHLFHANLDILVPQVAHITSDVVTPCLGATHPYHFYAQAQIDVSKGNTIGDGKMGRGCQLATVLMMQDLIAAFWQVGMAEDHTAGVGDMLFSATKSAMDPSMALTLCALTRHQGSLYYPDKTKYAYTYNVKYPEEATGLCKSSANNPCSNVEQ